MKKEDVGKGYYCEYIEYGIGCPAIKRNTCVGCKGRRRKLRHKTLTFDRE